MAHLTLTAEHKLAKEEALRRLKGKLGSMVVAGYRRKVSDLYEEWDEDTFFFRFKAVGMKVSGTVTVSDSEVRFAADVPFAVVLLKAKIDRGLRAELDVLLN